jgi:hypothetical protein
VAPLARSHRKRKETIDAHSILYPLPPLPPQPVDTAGFAPSMTPPQPPLPLSFSLSTWPKSTAGPAMPQPCSAAPRHGGRLRVPRASAKLCLIAPSTRSTMGKRSDGGEDCDAGCRGCMSSPRYQRPRMGDGAATYGELYASASLDFTSSKEILRCAENTWCKRMFEVFWMF